MSLIEPENICRLTAGLGLDEKEVKRLASMSQEKRVEATAK
jgi:hypothetical protein